MDRRLRPRIRCAPSSTSTASKCYRVRTTSSSPQRRTAEAASAELSNSQRRTRTGIIAVGFALVPLGLGFSWLIGRSITRPLDGLADAMKRLADGDTTARIPATRASDEIGAMARTVIVFRDNMVEREKLTAIQTEASRSQGTAQRDDCATIARFEKSVDQIAGQAAGRGARLEDLGRPQQRRRPVSPKPAPPKIASTPPPTT